MAKRKLSTVGKCEKVIDKISIVEARQATHKQLGFRMAYRNISYRGTAFSGVINTFGVTSFELG